MNKYKIALIGYDTCEWGHIDKEIIVEANNKEEALEKANAWCKENTYMGGYEWYFNSYRGEVKENE